MICTESGYVVFVNMEKHRLINIIFAFFDRFEKIAEQPYLYQAVDHIRAGYRHSVCGIDTIYYRIEGDTVEIMNILGQQNTDEALY